MTCHCGKKYTARKSDVLRGWGKSCSKHCAAVKRARRERSGNFKRADASQQYAARGDARSKERRERAEYHESSMANEMGWDAHKSSC